MQSNRSLVICFQQTDIRFLVCSVISFNRFSDSSMWESNLGRCVYGALTTFSCYYLVNKKNKIGSNVLFTLLVLSFHRELQETFSSYYPIHERGKNETPKLFTKTSGSRACDKIYRLCKCRGRSVTSSMLHLSQSTAGLHMLRKV